MSRVSIYEARWIDLVFENRNQVYGAYQLRRENAKNSLFALIMGLLFVASIVVISEAIHYLNPNVKTDIINDVFPDKIIQVDRIVIPQKANPILPEVKSQTSEATIPKAQLTNPVIVHSNEAVQEVPKNIENKTSTDVVSNGTGTVGLNPSTSPGIGTETETPKAVDYGNTVVNAAILDKRPEFPGGMDQFYKYVGNTFENPEIDGLSTIRVYVSFVIEKDGSMTDIQVNKDPGYGLGKEAIRVLKSLKTKWIPGTINSKPVRTAYNLPIIIQIE